MATEILVEHLGDVQFEIKARHHTIICDQRLEDGGYDEGITPPEFLLASLGTCAGFYAVQYLKTRGLTIAGLRVRVVAEKAQAPARLGEFHIEVEYPHDLDEKHREGIDRAVKKCLIHNTLLHPPKIDVEILTPVAA